MQQKELKSEYEFFVHSKQFKKKHGQLELIQGKSPSTMIFKSADKKLVRRIVYPNEDDFRQWLPSLRFEIQKQNDLQNLYKDHVLKIADYTYEKIGKEFIFSITYNCNPDQTKPLFDQLSTFIPNNTQFLNKMVIKLLEIGIILQNTGICHTNIKPSNLLICGEKILLTDFGSMRTHYRNYQAIQKNNEENNWRKYNLCFRSKEFQDAIKSQDIETFLKKKDNLIQQDIWALGIVILQLFQNNPKQIFDYWKNNKDLIAKIRQLQTRQFCTPVVDALKQLFNNEPVRTIYDQLFSSQFSASKKPQDFLTRDKKLNYEFNLIYSSDLKKIKDNQTNFDIFIDSQIQPKKIKRELSCESVLGQYDNENNRLITEENFVLINSGEPDDNPSQFIETNTGQGFSNHEQVRSKKEQNLEQPITQNRSNTKVQLLEKSVDTEIQQNQNIVPQSHDQQLIRGQQQFNTTEQQIIESQKGNVQIEPLNYQYLTSFKFFIKLGEHQLQQEFLAQLFEISIKSNDEEKKFKHLSALNLILENEYQDIDIILFQYSDLKPNDDEEEILISLMIKKGKLNVPQKFFHYLKEFPDQLHKPQYNGYTLTQKYHGLGRMISNRKIYQGIFHLGSFLWGSVFEIISENLLMISTGTFSLKQQSMDVTECDIEYYENKNNQKFEFIEHYNGNYKDGVIHGKQIYMDQKL